jgi:hypothetical protein
MLHTVRYYESRVAYSIPYIMPWVSDQRCETCVSRDKHYQIPTILIEYLLEFALYCTTAYTPKYVLQNGIESCPIYVDHVVTRTVIATHDRLFNFSLPLLGVQAHRHVP